MFRPHVASLPGAAAGESSAWLREGDSFGFVMECDLRAAEVEDARLVYNSGRPGSLSPSHL